MELGRFLESVHDLTHLIACAFYCLNEYQKEGDATLLYIPLSVNDSKVSLCFLSRDVSSAIDLASNTHPDGSC